MTVYQLPRNDVAACVAYYEARGQITTDEAQVMAMLQDDPSALAAVSHGWRVVSDKLGSDVLLLDEQRAKRLTAALQGRIVRYKPDGREYVLTEIRADGRVGLKPSDLTSTSTDLIAETSEIEPWSGGAAAPLP